MFLQPWADWSVFHHLITIFNCPFSSTMCPYPLSDSTPLFRLCSHGSNPLNSLPNARFTQWLPEQPHPKQMHCLLKHWNTCTFWKANSKKLNVCIELQVWKSNDMITFWSSSLLKSKRGHQRIVPWKSVITCWKGDIWMDAHLFNLPLYQRVPV